MLHVSSLTRRYGTFVAVSNVSFDIAKGEIVGLLGHNGAGKTTIMKMLSGYLEPDAGNVTINDLSLDENPKAIQAQLGYLPENLPVYPEMSVADYLDYAAHMKGIEGEEKAAEIKRVVVATDIAEKLLEPIYTLSRGFKQRVGVAQAILGKPQLLILDEPTNGLDPTQTEHMRALIKEIAKDATVILSTHIMQEVDAICDRVLIVNRGQLAVDEKLEALRKSNHINLSCSLDESSIKQALNNINANDIVLTSDENNIYTYQVLLTEEQDPNPLCASMANSVVSANGSLYQLAIQKRDLESLFKEVNQGLVNVNGTKEEGVSNAA